MQRNPRAPDCVAVSMTRAHRISVLLGLAALPALASPAGAATAADRAPRMAGAAEVAQLRRHATVRSGARWRLAFTDGHRVAAQVRAVVLHRGTPEGAAAWRLGC
jgi:hypothetical protein